MYSLRSPGQRRPVKLRLLLWRPLLPPRPPWPPQRPPLQPPSSRFGPRVPGAVRVVRAGGATRAVMVEPGGTPAAMAGPQGARRRDRARLPNPKKIPLDEVDSIRFERTPALTARFVGQPNLDFTMPGLSAKKEEPAPAPEGKKDAAAPSAEAKKDETKKDEGSSKTGRRRTVRPRPSQEGRRSQGRRQKEGRCSQGRRQEGRRSQGRGQKEGRAPKADAKKADTPKAEAKKKADDPKAEEKKTDGSDDVLAPPPGTTITKFPKVEPKKNGIRDLCLSLFGLQRSEDQASHRQLPDGQGPDELAARHVGFSGLAAGRSPAGE